MTSMTTNRPVGRAAAPASGFRLESFVTLLFTGAIMAGLAFGWSIRNEFIITPEHGLGYVLGIVGATLMLLVLAYPLKKHLPRANWLRFSTPAWFRIHMTFGLLGPLAILYHCNFSLGSTNSTVALLSMLVMVASGLIGRYLYTRVHLGLYGERAALENLRKRKFTLQHDLEERKDTLRISPDLIDGIEHAEEKIASATNRIAGVLRSAFASRRIRRQLRRRLLLDQRGHRPFESLSTRAKAKALRGFESDLDVFLDIVRRIAQLTFFERMFSLWHTLHMPIFFILVLSGAVHVYAVHVY